MREDFGVVMPRRLGAAYGVWVRRAQRRAALLGDVHLCSLPSRARPRSAAPRCRYGSVTNSWSRSTCCLGSANGALARREAARVRGHGSVQLDASIATATATATAPDRVLRGAEHALFAVAGGLFVLLVTTDHPAVWPPLLVLGLAFAVQRERDRRSHRP